MRFLTCSLLILGLSACRSDYGMMTSMDDVQAGCREKIFPRGIATSWYDAGVDVYGRHISGLLLIKQLPDSAYRTVFMNEAGVTYFDLAWDREAHFTRHHVIAMMDKTAVIQTLRKDLELLLGIPFRSGIPVVSRLGERIYFGVPQKNEMAYFITGQDCASLQGLELGSKRKRKVSIALYGWSRQLPDSLAIQHHTFDMRISLKKIEKE